MSSGWLWVLWVASCCLACEAERVAPSRERRPTSLVLIHTADLHSHLFPEPLLVSSSDAARGLGEAGRVSDVGGFARIASIVKTIRLGAERSAFLDSGDLVEGTAAFSEFQGEPELRACSALELGAAALGNHDLEPGAEQLRVQHQRFATFPVLAANLGDNGSELAAALAPSVVLHLAGLELGVIGVANPNSPSGLSKADNAFGAELLPLAASVQAQIDALRGRADVIVLLSHLGLSGDEALIAATSGLDVVLGGHQHLAFETALSRFDCADEVREARGCEPRRVVLVHSGALGRYVGELDLSLAVADPPGGANEGLEVVSARYQLLPVSDAVEEDAGLAALLEPYRARLHALGFDRKVAFALGPVERYATDGGDSALGNLITDAIRSATHADVVLVNSTGIRADLTPGELTRAAFAAALPFADRLTRLTVTGAQLLALLNEQARVASGRDCQSPIQVAGLEVTFKCSGAASTASVRVAGLALEPRQSYDLVTSEYLAAGGGGFDVLLQASARVPLEVDPLDLTLAAVAQLPACTRSDLPCIDPSRFRDGRIQARRPD